MSYTKEEMMAQGFRAMAFTAHIETQLAHAERNKVKAAYNHEEYLLQCTEMVAYLDKLRNNK